MVLNTQSQEEKEEERHQRAAPSVNNKHQTPEVGFEEYEFSSVRCIDDTDRGLGRLRIRESDIMWQGDEESVSIPFKDISVSAVADCPETYQSVHGHCLYLQLDSGDDDDILREVYMIPSSTEDLDALFKAMCDGALRNPDSDVDEENGHMFFDMESAVMGSFEETLGIHDDG